MLSYVTVIRLTLWCLVLVDAFSHSLNIQKMFACRSPFWFCTRLFLQARSGIHWEFSSVRGGLRGLLLVFSCSAPVCLGMCCTAVLCSQQLACPLANTVTDLLCAASLHLCASEPSESGILNFFLAAVMNNSVCIYPYLGQNLFLKNCSRIPPASCLWLDKYKE